MNKKRKVAIAILSPVLVAGIIVISFVALVQYAATGKWELKQMVKECIES